MKKDHLRLCYYGCALNRFFHRSINIWFNSDCWILYFILCNCLVYMFSGSKHLWVESVLSWPARLHNLAQYHEYLKDLRPAIIRVKVTARHIISNSIICPRHYDDVINTMMASQITSLTIVYSTVYSGAYQRKHQSSALLAFVRGIHRRPVNSPHKWPVRRKMFPLDDVIIACSKQQQRWVQSSPYHLPILGCIYFRKHKYNIYYSFWHFSTPKWYQMLLPGCNRGT